MDMPLDRITDEERPLLETYEEMQYLPSTGEAICNELHTKWFFKQKVTQELPTPGQPLDGPRTPQAVTPWGFLTEDSAERLLSMVAAVLPAPITVTIGFGDPNSQFPQSVLPRELQFRTIDTPGKMYRFSAGLNASAIARTTFYDAVLKVQKQAPEGVIRDLLKELQGQISANQDS